MPLKIWWHAVYIYAYVCDSPQCRRQCKHAAVCTLCNRLLHTESMEAGHLLLAERERGEASQTGLFAVGRQYDFKGLIKPQNLALSHRMEVSRKRGREMADYLRKYQSCAVATEGRFMSPNFLFI